MSFYTNHSQNFLFFSKGENVIEINKIRHGDCLDLMQDIPDKTIDMILCDLPCGTTWAK